MSGPQPYGSGFFVVYLINMIKKIFIITLILSVSLGLTTTTFAAAKDKDKEAKPAKEVKANVPASLERQLEVGMKGEDVKELQRILADEPDMYPEKLITGFFGLLTKKAVKKFQKKHGLEQVGRVGKKTLEKLKKVKKDKKEKVTTPTVVPSTASSTPMTPSVVATTTASTTQPQQNVPAPQNPFTISSTNYSTVNASTTKITWTTSEYSTSEVTYSVSSPVLTGPSAPISVFGESGTNHEVVLTGLSANTTYYFFVSSTNNLDFTVHTNESSFVSSSAVVNVAP